MVPESFTKCQAKADYKHKIAAVRHANRMCAWTDLRQKIPRVRVIDKACPLRWPATGVILAVIISFGPGLYAECGIILCTQDVG